MIVLIGMAQHILVNPTSVTSACNVIQFDVQLSVVSGPKKTLAQAGNWAKELL